jgi:hypothetical protein
MGDRCWIRFKFHQRDLPKVQKVFSIKPPEEANDPTEDFDFEEVERGDNGIIYCTDSEANYGCYDEVQEMANLGVAFCGRNDSGGSYGASAWCGVDGQFFEIGCDHDGHPVILVDEDDNGKAIPEPGQIETAQAYFDALKRVQQQFEAAAQEVTK